MSPRIVDKGKKRREIALKALDVFVERGFESASVAEIARRAGIAKGGVYDYFASKDDLIFASLIHWAEGMEREAQPRFAKLKDPRDKLRVMCKAWVDIALSDPRTAKIMITMPRLVMSKRFRRHQRMMYAMMAESVKDVALMIEEGVEQGIFKPGARRDAQRIALNLHAYLDGIMLHYLIMKDYIDIKQNIDLYLDELIAGISVGRKRQGAKAQG